ncbi:division plane positioning ATPase MipZ [uncultured Ferrovibrio sp.]|jgi:ATPases involved in chromosome partitioning|uniref:division plane positioning ATPase MipZ n=1 Tax=uncultured Ferrovibrio sp. TaxID=1576913 RepID=UPI00262C59A5|nr:division plane positioning ATPase MipZ [uncultured Ferrovibrio sp.]
MDAPVQEPTRARIIVVGNEKGGSGKSTTAMHILTGLLLEGGRVAAVDLDSKQRTLTRYLENRQAFITRNGLRLPMPEFVVVPESDLPLRTEADADEAERVAATLADLAPRHDFILIDCPGSDTNLSRIGHSYADLLITPVNDSFIDVDLLATVDPDTLKVIKPSRYAVMVWEQRKQRFARDRQSVDWVVIRNRLSHLDARNKRNVGHVLQSLEKRIGFRFLPGLSERVIFRELFLSGLTLMDLDRTGGGINMAQAAARQEMRNLLLGLNLITAD